MTTAFTGLAEADVDDAFKAGLKATVAAAAGVHVDQVTLTSFTYTTASASVEVTIAVADAAAATKASTNFAGVTPADFITNLKTASTTAGSTVDLSAVTATTLSGVATTTAAPVVVEKAKLSGAIRLRVGGWWLGVVAAVIFSGN